MPIPGVRYVMVVAAANLIPTVFSSWSKDVPDDTREREFSSYPYNIFPKKSSPFRLDDSFLRTVVVLVVAVVVLVIVPAVFYPSSDVNPN